MPITRLPPLLVNQIAAGEVIERPASVVKELLENSLDAGARRIDLTIEEGGMQLIRLQDDGAGIPGDELPLAIASHATSKLLEADDLLAIASFGFRGEALASIASVSRLRIASKPRETGAPAPQTQGAVIEVAGANSGEIRPQPMAPGTVIEVRDLFFNVPARRKFIRTTATEFGHIHETVQRLAMVHPQVRFTLTHNGRMVRELSATSDPLRRCLDLLGRELEEAMLRFDRTEPIADQPVRIWGLAGVPALVRNHGRQQYLYINRRAVRDRQLTHALREAYRGLMPSDRQPVAVIFVDMPPDHVDVNVHPAKSEVRLRHPGPMHALVLAAVRQSLQDAAHTPILHLDLDNHPSTAAWQLPSQAGPTPYTHPGSGQGATGSAPNFAASMASMGSAQGRLDLESLRTMRSAADQPLPAPPPASVQRHDILQVHRRYVVTSDEQGLLIVDQHALHERVMYESLWQRIFGQQACLESQRLLMPVILTLDQARLDAAEALEELLTRIGVELAPIGPGRLAVQAFPSFLFDRQVEAEPFLLELFDQVIHGDLDPSGATAQETALHRVMDLMSCKAAVKAGDAMSDGELAELLSRRTAIERASHCPHGRPTTLRLTRRELDGHFKRT